MSGPQGQYAVRVVPEGQAPPATRSKSPQEYTAAELRQLSPPRNESLLLAEWQVFVNMRAAHLEEVERAEAATRAAPPAKRRYAPQDDTQLDELVELTISAGEFTAQAQLRDAIGCGFHRLVRSLARLTRAGRIRLEPLPAGQGGIRHVWRKA